MAENFGFGTDFGTATVVDDTSITGATEEVNGADDFQFDESTGGTFPPRILPGPVKFRYEVTKFTEATDGKDSQIEYTAHVQTAGLGPGRLLKEQGLTEIPVRFNRASSRKTAPMKEKKVPSDMERLYSALGLVEEVGKPTSKTQMENVLRNAGGRYAEGNLVWEVSNKRADGTYERFSTSPNTKGRNKDGSPNPDKAWPRLADGTLATSVTFEDGIEKVGQERIGSLKAAPKAKKGGA